MKHRFETEKPKSPWKGPILSVLLFCLIVGCFSLGISAVSDKTDAQELRTLEQAINRGVVRCYSIEGSYPESLDYLKENYGLSYDEDRFFVDYQILGSNLMPDITIIEREGGGKP